MLTFWETVRGVELADTLIRTLPAIADGNKEYKDLLADLAAIRQDIADIKSKLEKEE